MRYVRFIGYVFQASRENALVARLRVVVEREVILPPVNSSFCARRARPTQSMPLGPALSSSRGIPIISAPASAGLSRTGDAGSPSPSRACEEPALKEKSAFDHDFDRAD